MEENMNVTHTRLGLWESNAGTDQLDIFLNFKNNQDLELDMNAGTQDASVAHKILYRTRNGVLQ